MKSLASKIKIVTDSTSDLPQELVKKHDIHVVPLYVNFSDATYKDGVDLAAKDFYPMLEKAKDSLPKTSMPSVGDFVKVYESLLQQGYEILSIHISSGLSGTASVAETAAGMLKGRISVFDSKSISAGIGLQVLEAMEMVKQNLSLEHILSRLEEVRQRTEVFFSLDTLEYLEKGGRIGRVSALLGSLLKIKPVVRVENGIYVPLDRVRNQKQAIQKMVEHMVKTLAGHKPKGVAVVHGAAEELAKELKKLVEETVGIKISLFKETGPVIGVHTGPGTLGVGFTY